MWVRDGKAVRIEPYGELKPCMRGYAYIQRVYSTDRLATPLRRVGERGEGRFEADLLGRGARRWSPANSARVLDTYGPAAIFCVGSSGAPGRLHNPAPIFRLLNMLGGYTARWGSASAEAAYFAAQATYGTVPTAHTRDDLKFSKFVLLWGWNPAETIHGTDTMYHVGAGQGERDQVHRRRPEIHQHRGHRGRGVDARSGPAPIPRCSWLWRT